MQAVMNWHWRFCARWPKAEAPFKNPGWTPKAGSNAISQVKGRKDPHLGWFSKHYGHLEPAPLLRVSVQGELPLRITSRLSVVRHGP